MAGIFVNEAAGWITVYHFAYASCPSAATNSLSLDFQKRPGLDNIVSLLRFISRKKKKEKKKTTKPELQSLASPYCIIISWSFYLRDEIRVLWCDNKHTCWDTSEFLFTHAFFTAACPVVDPASVLIWFKT